MNTARAGCLGVARDVNFGERVTNDQRRLTHLSERSAGRRVEIKVQVIGAIHIIAARIPRIEIDTTQVHDPRQPGRIVHDDLKPFPLPQPVLHKGEIPLENEIVEFPKAP